jgi:hypothetical protein
MIRLQGNEARGQIAIALRTLICARTPLSRRAFSYSLRFGFRLRVPAGNEVAHLTPSPVTRRPGPSRSPHLSW